MSLTLLSISFATLSVAKTEAFSAFGISKQQSLSSSKHPSHNSPWRHSNSNRTPSSFSSILSNTALLDTNGGGDDDTPSTLVAPSSLKSQMLAEAVGTFFIVHLGCGTVCSALYHSAQVGLWQIAAVWSLAVSLAIYCTASISGAHLNPAISIAMKLVRPDDDSSWGKVGAFCMSQLAGAVLAAGLNLALFWESIKTFETTKGIVRGTLGSVVSASAFGEYWSVSSWKQALLAETVGTSILSFVIFSLTNSKNDAIQPGMIPAVIGATVGCLISVIAPLTQAGFNPARDFGPRIVTMMSGWGLSVSMKGWWVYVLGPIVGAVLGGLLAEKVLWASSSSDKK